MQAVSAGLLVVLTLALVLLTLAYAIFTNKLRNATDTLQGESLCSAKPQSRLLQLRSRWVQPRSLQPTANYAPCYENPAATGCPGNYQVNQNTGAHSYKGAEHPTRHTIRHHG